YEIAIGVTPPTQVAARVQGRPEPVRQHLVAALDECLLRPRKGDAQARQWLLDALAAADNDRWRTGVRQARAAGDWSRVEQLAREAKVSTQPPSFLLLVAAILPEAMRAARLELVRRTQRAYPADLWANSWLGHELMENGQPAEATRYWTAALALQPKNA